MEINEFFWDNINIDHISRHQVMPEEIEEIAFDDDPYVKKHSKVRYLYGQTVSGRYLFTVFIMKGWRIAKVITSRDMDEKERKLYCKRK